MRIRLLHGRFVASVGALVLALATLFGAAPAALAAPAHARYLSSDPAANATVKTAPSVVTLHFAEPVNPAGSAVVIYDAKGQTVSQPAQVDQSDLKTMHVQMQGDDSEVYLVYWHTVSAADGDPDVGAFSFFVSANGASELAAPAATGSTPTTTHAAAAATGTPAWLTVLLVALGLAVGAFGAIVWERRRQSGADAR